MIIKRFELTLFAVLCYSFAMACSVPAKSFCRTFQLSPEIPTVTGKIIGVDELGIDLQIIEIHRGEVLDQTIRIWDGTDFDCNGLWSMAASDLGDLNDTVIIILHQIIEQENEWDVIGDYRRPDNFGRTPSLKLENGLAKGLVSGINGAPLEFQNWSMEYELFKQLVIEEEDCSVIVNIEDLYELPDIKFNNPFTTELRIQFDQPIQKGTLRLYSISGKIAKVWNMENHNELELNTANLQTGIYFLEIWTDEKRLDIIKVVKM